jgi:hypothetical protein
MNMLDYDTSGVALRRPRSGSYPHFLVGKNRWYAIGRRGSEPLSEPQ